MPIDRCFIADRAVDEIGVLRGSWPAGASVEVVAGSTGDRAVIVSGKGPIEAGVLPKLPSSVSVLLDEGNGTLRRLRGRTTIRERAAGRDWRVTGSGFWQVHPKAADVLVDAVLSALRPRPGDLVLDLYSGVGLFAGALADRVAPGGAVTAIESDTGAVRDARRNLHDHHEVRVVTGSVERMLHRVSGPTDLVVLDPPRRGAGRKVVEAIASRGPRAVAYVACDPAALGRDVAIFGGRGYRLAGLRCFDLFPMTHHVECVALLTPGQSPAELY
jgi:tRNA/tmRNA/rRNA uracil-C5-methylase (TrmA/RlmC/RlmD family)